jgi:hypothetical protein
MSADKWEVVAEIFGELEAELIRGLLEAGGVEVFLSQEGAGRAYGLNVGSLGKVQVLVPSRDLQSALDILSDYNAGKYASTELETPDDDPSPES